MTRLNYFIILFGLFIISFTSCNDDNSGDCFDHVCYLSMVVNNKPFCYSYCTSDIVDNTSKISSVYISDFINFLTAGNITKRNDSLFYNPLVSIIFPNKIKGLYNNDSIKGFDFIFYIKTDKGDFTFPFYSVDSIGYISRFNLNITEYDELQGIIKGEFNGLLYNFSLTDSIVISDGIFKSIKNNKTVVEPI
jgi:hypothetical protein